jgi:hypothetical protein
LKVVEPPKMKKTIGNCGAIRNKKAIELSNKDFLLTFNLVLDFF